MISHELSYFSIILNIIKTTYISYNMNLSDLDGKVTICCAWFCQFHPSTTNFQSASLLSNMQIENYRKLFSLVDKFMLLKEYIHFYNNVLMCLQMLNLFFY